MWSFFFRCLNCAPDPPTLHVILVAFFFFSSSVFRPFDVSLWFLLDQLTRGYVLPQFVFSFTALMYSTNPSVVGIYKNNS